MKDFRSLDVWQKPHQFTLRVYAATSRFPAREAYGLTAQMRRSAASVPANIAEGCGRNGNADFARFLQMAMGSASETEYHLVLARDLGYLAVTDYQELSRQGGEVKRMLVGLLKKVRSAV